MEGFFKLITIMALVAMGTAANNASEPLGQGSFSSSYGPQITINYYATPSSNSMSSFYAYGYGTADNTSLTGQFILAGQATGNMGQSESVCIEGTMSLADKSWSINGRSGNKLVTGTGNYKMDSSMSTTSSAYGSFEVHQGDLTITNTSHMLPPVCGQFMLSDPSNKDSNDYSYTWSGTTKWDAESSVSWTAYGSKYGGIETHSITGSMSSTGSNMYSMSPSGCLTSLKIENSTDSFTGSGHINGRRLNLSGRLHSGMFLADMLSLDPASGIPGYTGSFSYNQWSPGSFYSSTSSNSISGSIYENGTWTTMQPGMGSENNGFKGTYSMGSFKGSGKLNLMDATVSGQYGASCWFTDSVEVTCPTNAPNTTGPTSMYMFYDGSFYLCGMATSGTANNTQLTASGWIFTAKNESDPMKLTAESITLSGDIQVSDPMMSSSTQKMDFTIIDSSGKAIVSYKGDSYVYLYSGQVSGSASNNNVTLSISNGIVMGSQFAVTGSLMKM